MKQLLALTLLGAALVSCAPGITTLTSATPDGKLPLQPGETRVYQGNEVTLNPVSTLIAGLTYPGNSHRVAGSSRLDGFMKDAFKAGSPYRCSTFEHQLWFEADGPRLQAQTTQRLETLGFTTRSEPESRGARVAAANGKVSYLMSWVYTEDIASVSACLIEKL